MKEETLEGQNDAVTGHARFTKSMNEYRILDTHVLLALDWREGLL